MKKIKKRLDDLTRLILEAKDPASDECAAFVAELKMLRELIATWKAFGSVDDFAFDDDAEVREKRTASGSWE